jgi:hypothetical protein
MGFLEYDDEPLGGEFIAEVGIRFLENTPITLFDVMCSVHKATEIHL